MIEKIPPSDERSDFVPSYDLERISPEDAEELVSSIMYDIEGISPLVYDQFSEPIVAQGIVEACRRPDGEIDIELLRGYVANSSRFSEASHRRSDVIFGETVVIPEDDQNLHESGNRRREESGQRLEVEALRAVGIDPQYVLMFRVTQPSAEPKPELYWTSDPSETLHGLNVELGSRASSAIILIDSLAAIARNDGLIRDINDDGGVAVRQIGLGSYDQASALASMKRPGADSLSFWS